MPSINYPGNLTACPKKKEFKFRKCFVSRSINEYMLRKIKRIVNKWLPGIISGGADNDPAGITTYSLSGVKFGYQQLWLMVLATPMLLAVQAMCARLSDVTRKGLM